jgi:hypothetical protein
MEDFGAAIRSSLANRREYAAAQRAHFADTFDLTDTPSAVRAAEAIANYLEARMTFKGAAAPTPLRAVC